MSLWCGLRGFTRNHYTYFSSKSTQAHLDRFCIDFGLDEPVVRTPWIHMLSYIDLLLVTCHLLWLQVLQVSGYRYTGIQVTGNRQSVLQVTGKSTQAHLDRFCIDFGLDEPPHTGSNGHPDSNDHPGSNGVGHSLGHRCLQQPAPRTSPTTPL